MATSVPNTNTFSMQDVKNVTDANDLIRAFSVAESDGFDSQYSGEKNSLYNFRNYRGIALYETARGTTVFKGFSCRDVKWIKTKYLGLLSTQISVGDTVYENTNATSLLGTGYYYIPVGPTGYSIEIGNSGKVTRVAPCAR